MQPNGTSKNHDGYGHRMIPLLLDELASTTPNHVYSVLPRGDDYTSGTKDITIQMMARAVNRTAFWIESILGRNSEFETVAYLGPSDLRYFIVALAATKVGYKTLFTSPRNSAERHATLFDATKCRTLITAAGTKVEHILAERPMRHFTIMSLEESLSEKPVADYPYSQMPENLAKSPFIVVHTSGSTGLPKPITTYHGGLATVDYHHVLPSLDSSLGQANRLQGSRSFSVLPPFHIAGVIQSLAIAIYFQITIIWPPTGRPISADLLDHVLDTVAVDLCFVAPSMLEDMSQSQSSLEKLKKLESVSYAGGPLGQSAGDTLSKYVKVVNLIGSSEVGFFPTFSIDSRDDWMYMKYDPRLKGMEFREVSNGLYEQVFVRHPSTDPYIWLWYTFPDRSEFSVNDLYSKHPSKPNLWLYEGRSDDILVLSNGEKLNPTSMEATLRSHPDIHGALVVGQARFQPAVLLELNQQVLNSEEAKRRFLESLPSFLDEINESAPSHARLQPELVFLMNNTQAMIRTDKGTVKRLATNKAYQAEIDRLYANAANNDIDSDAAQIDARDLDTITQALNEMASKTLGLIHVKPDQDFFAAGADSLRVMNLVRQLRSSFTAKEGGIPTDLISPRIVYSNPTVSKLAYALHGLATQGEKTYEELEKSRVEKMEALLNDFSHDFSRISLREERLNVVLTGSTGSLGSYLLDQLLGSSRISKIFCLNRGIDSEAKQLKSNLSRGLISHFDDRVHFLTTALGEPNLGLKAEDYDLLVKETSFIIHNQWQVDFNLSLESFEAHIAGVRDLIQISTRSPKHPPILFTSSIATLGNWTSKHPGTKVPEHAFHNFSIPAAQGYGESKYVAERLLEKATEQLGVSAAICRVGQLAGPVVKGGVWNKQEWLPSLIASSKFLGKIPASTPGQDAVTWVPVDTTARIIVDLVLSDIEESSSSRVPWLRYHNIVNPNPGEWSTLVPAVTRYFDNKVEPVNFSAWFDALKATASRTEDVAKNPAVKLLEFFEGMGNLEADAELETSQTVARSEAMRGLKPVGEEWMEIWLKQWDF